MDEGALTLARALGVHGEVAVRRRRSGDGPPVFELIVNGVFVMDTAETSTERLLADALLERHPAPRRVLVGGLGFGITVANLLADVRVEQVDVVEIEPLLVGWLREGLVPGVDTVLADPRVRVVVADIRDGLRTAEPASYDGILLDVDNGPGFLVHPGNAAVYEHRSLKEASQALCDGGMLAVWSADPAPRLQAALKGVLDSCAEVRKSAVRSGREVTYHVYLATK